MGWDDCKGAKTHISKSRELRGNPFKNTSLDSINDMRWLLVVEFASSLNLVHAKSLKFSNIQLMV